VKKKFFDKNKIFWTGEHSSPALWPAFQDYTAGWDIHGLMMTTRDDRRSTSRAACASDRHRVLNTLTLHNCITYSLAGVRSIKNDHRSSSLPRSAEQRIDRASEPRRLQLQLAPDRRFLHARTQRHLEILNRARIDGPTAGRTDRRTGSGSNTDMR